MLFNSLPFIFVFMPLTAIVYFLLNKRHLTLFANIALIVASFIFYGLGDIHSVRVMLGSILVNFAFTSQINRLKAPSERKGLLIVGIIFNVALLCYYKYAVFFAENANFLLGTHFDFSNIFLPLAISFLTFQQIAYLVDTYHDETKEYDFFDYALFICFFPKLISGPITAHRELMPQIKRARNRFVNWENVYKGLFIFSIGLFKKVMIADKLVEMVGSGYSEYSKLSMLQAWETSLCYTMQLYLDFSGYCDMAMGAALILNIRLPVNFNSPYKACNIQDFWRRWHITLSRWLMAYIYIPLGGNRKGLFRTYVNLFVVFLVGGFWHGAGWPFIVWGALHGSAMVCHRFWMTHGFKMPAWLGWVLTMCFVNIAWIFFRASDINVAWCVTQKLFDFASFSTEHLQNLAAPVVLLAFARLFPNSIEWLEKVDARKRWGIFAALLTFGYVLVSLRVSEFIYANF